MDSDKYLQWKARDYFFTKASDFFYGKVHAVKSRFFFLDGDSIRSFLILALGVGIEQRKGSACLIEVILFILLNNSPKRYAELLATEKSLVVNKTPFLPQTADFLTTVMYPPIKATKTVVLVRKC